MNPDSISRLSQYDFKTEYFSVTPKQVKLLSNEDDCKIISGLESIYNCLKVVNNVEEKKSEISGRWPLGKKKKREEIMG